MSDSRLRDLERRWRETGASQDEAALLLERVRVGSLPEERLELAARLGHSAAQLALGIDSAKNEVELLTAVSRVPPHTATQLAIAMGRAVWVALREGATGPFGDPVDLDHLERMTSAVERWFVRPTERTASAVQEVVREGLPGTTRDPVSDLARHIAATLEHPRAVKNVLRHSIALLTGHSSLQGDLAAACGFLKAAFVSAKCPHALLTDPASRLGHHGTEA